MQRRLFVASFGLPALLVPSWVRAKPDEQDAPVVRSTRIIEALGERDIVLDKPGAAQPKPPSGKPKPGAIDLQVAFTFDSAELRPQGKRQLDELAMALNHQTLRSASFELAGHTDRVGSHAHNMRLSLDRAEAVKAYLMNAHQLPAQRLFAIGFGFTRLADASNPESAVNRRVEVRRLRAAPPTSKPGGQLVPTPR